MVEHNRLVWQLRDHLGECARSHGSHRRERLADLEDVQSIVFRWRCLCRSNIMQKSSFVAPQRTVKNGDGNGV